MADRIPEACKSETLESRMAAAKSFGESAWIITATVAECQAAILPTTDQKRLHARAITEDSDGYVCAFTDGAPWMTTWDIRRDGIIGRDDVKALLWQEGPSSLDNEPERQEIDCEKVGLALLEAEVAWRLQGLIAGLPDRPAAPKAVVAQVGESRPTPCAA